MKRVNVNSYFFQKLKEKKDNSTIEMLMNVQLTERIDYINRL